MKSLIKYQPHHMRFARAMRLFFIFYFYFQWLQQKKKKNLFFICLFYIYNFYFENLIYKWIKKFENQQESNPIFQAMFQWKLGLYFYWIVLQFCLYLNIGMQGYFRKKKNQIQIREALKQQYRKRHQIKNENHVLHLPSA